MNKKIYNIRGMHCRSCELLIEQNIGEIAGVRTVEASYKKGLAIVYFDDTPPAEAKIQRAIADAGYALGTAGMLPWFERDPKEYFILAMGGAVLFVLFLGAKIAGFETFAPNFGDAPAYPVVMFVGLTAGISTCMALVGGLVLGLSARHAELHPEASRWDKFKPHLSFNAGRIITFALLGGAIGSVGSVFRISTSVVGWFVALAGIVMLILGLKLIEIFPKFSALSFSLPAAIGKWFGLNRRAKHYSHSGSMLAGALTFFLPCGFTQAMQVYAISTGNFISGALIMGLFAVGTVPGLLGIGGLMAFVKGAFGKMFFKFVGLAVILFAFLNISSGMTLTGFRLPNLTVPVEKQAQKTNLPPIENGFQVIRMRQLSGGYEPNRFTVRKGIPVRWEIEGTTLYSCSNAVVIPSLRVGTRLQMGSNVLEFTPPQAGRLAFSCAMGMYRGYFDVVE